MRRRLITIALPILYAAAATLPLIGCGKSEGSTARFTPLGVEQEVRGTVTEAKLTMCAPTAGKVGTCKGMLGVEPAGAAARVPVEVTRDVLLTKGGQAVLLPQLRGSQVVVKYRATKEGANVAASVVGR